ncbi:uncharacterized protein [Gossypium hirsutum]|uniref:Uncharacterized protein isoform X2 n=1 Tax=Gossypium hirsutum TaxID=3635 RepID=A0ABM3B584_GOSHI|nr:uncharacterized protein LOC121223795 isoform X2 [Gossypium hirsutum]
MDSRGSRSQAPVFTQKQYNQIMHLLNKEPAAIEAAASIAGSPSVRLPNGSSVSVTHIGTCIVLPNLSLTISAVER